MKAGSVSTVGLGTAEYYNAGIEQLTIMGKLCLICLLQRDMHDMAV